jgi:integrase
MPDYATTPAVDNTFAYSETSPKGSQLHREQPAALRGTPINSWEAYDLAVRDRLSNATAAELAAVAISRGYKAERTDSATSRIETTTTPPASRVTFGYALQAYLLAGGEGRYVTPELLRLVASKLLGEIDQSFIDQIAITLLPHAAASTRNRQIYMLFSAVLKFGAAQGWCKYLRIRRPRSPKVETRLPSSDEIDRFVKAAGPSLKRIAIFLLHTDISVGATLRLEWHQVDLAKRKLCVGIGDGGRERLISLHPRVVEMLGHFLHRNGKVFRRPDGSSYQAIVRRGGQLKSAFRGACLRAEVSPITPRTLRRVWAARQTGSDFENWGKRNAA